VLLTCLMIESRFYKLEEKSDSMVDPLRETGEDSSLPYEFFFFFQVVYTTYL